MSNPVGDYVDCESLGIADCLFPGKPVTHHAGQFEGLGDPAAVVLAIQVNRQIHFSIIRLATPELVDKGDTRQLWPTS